MKFMTILNTAALVGVGVGVLSIFDVISRPAVTWIWGLGLVAIVILSIVWNPHDE